MNPYPDIISRYHGRLMLLLFGLLIIAGSTSLRAQVYPRQYLEEALENNPGLRAGYLAYEAATLQADIAAGLPSPEFTAGIFTPPMDRLMGRQLFDAGIMQMFPWFGTLSRQRSVSESMADASLGQYRSQRNELWMEITLRWYDMYETQQQMNIVRRFTEILQAREDIIYSRYQGGLQQGSLALDIYRLQMQLNELENRLSRLHERHRQQMRSFNILLNRQADTSVELPDTLMPLETIGEIAFPDTSAFRQNPMVEMAIAEARAAEIEQELAGLMTRPMIGIGLQYSHFAAGDAAMGQMDGGAMIMPMLSVTLPIYGKQNRAMRNQGAIMARMAMLQREEQLNNIAVDWVETAQNQISLSRDQEFLGRQLEISRNAWELVVNSYAGGQEGFDELLRIQDQLLEIEQRMLETIVGQHKSAVMMDMLMAGNVFE